jgi:ATP-dependent RNA helicase DDX52/ROK1
MESRFFSRWIATSVYNGLLTKIVQGRDLAAISPTGTGKTLAYTLPILSQLNGPSSRSGTIQTAGVRALVLAPTRELAHQIHNEFLKLAQGRKWRIVLLSKATASTLTDKTVRDQVGEFLK